MLLSSLKNGIISSSWAMTTPSRNARPISPQGIEGPPSNTGSDEAPILPRPKTILPKDLPTAIKHLDDRELDRLLGAAVVEEVGETVPTRERITDCLSEFGLLADQGELGAQPGFEALNDGPRP